MAPTYDIAVTNVEHPQQPFAPLLHAAFGALSAQVLYVAAKLDIADALQSGPQATDNLARKIRADAEALRRVLRGLVSLGICNEHEDGRFGLTTLGEYLRTDHPDSMKYRVLLNGELHYSLWGDLLETVTTGYGGSERVYGAPFFDHLARNPPLAAVFDRAMTGAGWVRYRFIPALEVYNFSQFGSIVDVGGGNGTFLVELLKTYPEPTGIVFDLPRLAQAAQHAVESAGLADRCQFIGGNAFESVPAGADAYVLSNFVIAWGDAEATVPLRNCRQAMGPNGKLILVEWVMPAGGEPAEGLRFWDTVTMDLIMLAGLGGGSGHVRTQAQFEGLLHSAGFRLANVYPTRASVSVIEAIPA